MAYEPCDCHAALFRGKSNYAYPAGISHGLRIGGRVRLCERGQTELLGVAKKHLDQLEEGLSHELQQQPVCGWCGEVAPPEPVARLYLTAYVEHKTRVDYAGWACATCLGQASQDLILRPIAAR